jgi:hypothetical protein
VRVWPANSIHVVAMNFWKRVKFNARWMDLHELLDAWPVFKHFFLLGNILFTNIFTADESFWKVIRFTFLWKGDNVQCYFCKERSLRSLNTCCLLMCVTVWSGGFVLRRTPHIRHEECLQLQGMYLSFSWENDIWRMRTAQKQYFQQYKQLFPANNFWECIWLWDL